MAEAQFIKQPGGLLRPANQVDVDAMQKVANGRLVIADIKQPRNPLFHRKFFALLNFAYDYWNPPEVEYKGIKAEKNFDRYRSDVTILAGYYTVTTDIRGNVKLEPKSISFAQMDDGEFENVYRSVFDVLWKQILQYVPNMTKAVADNTILQILSFDR